MTAEPRTVLVVGGGIAGLASGLALGQTGWRCTILEPDAERRRTGQGLLMPPSGQVALERLGLADPERFTAPIDSFELYGRQGQTLQSFAISGSLGVLHRDLLTTLEEALPESCRLVTGRCIGLEPLADGTWEVIGSDQTRWRADLIIAADGVGSLCRRRLFPEAQLTPEQTLELVLVAQDADLVHELRGSCRKFQDPQAGLALGLLPCRNGQLVVFAQFDSNRYAHNNGMDAGALLQHCFGGWNAQLDGLLSRLGASQGRLWHTTDLDPLPQLFAGNLVLVGDSGHPLLTVTSQGAASALEDALELAAALDGHTPADAEGLTSALERYSRNRLAVIRQFVQDGRSKQRDFLDPGHSLHQASAPLVGFGLEPLLVG
jgi:salicylate hydroxylase